MDEKVLETLRAVRQDLRNIKEEVRFGLISEDCVDILTTNICRMNEVIGDNK